MCLTTYRWPCCLVLFNNGASGIHLHLPEVMIGSMEGNAGFAVPVGAPAAEALRKRTKVFTKGGRMIRPGSASPQNTRISAIISLLPVTAPPERESDYTSECVSDFRVIVWENHRADISPPGTMFRGPYDERWVVEAGLPKRVFAGHEINKLDRRDA